MSRVSAWASKSLWRPKRVATLTRNVLSPAMWQFVAKSFVGRSQDLHEEHHPIRRDYLHYITKYRRYEKRHKMISAHCSPCFDARPGDEVMIGECRPLSKTVRYNVLEVHEKADRTGAKAAK